MDLGLQNKRALVLGSSQGLGLGIAKALLEEKVSVAILGRDPDKLTRLADSLSQQYQQTVIPIPANLQDEVSEKIIAEAIDKHFGGIDILINNTGGPPLMDILSIDQKLWQEYFNLMFIRLTNITKLFLPGMINQQWGRIINISSSGIVQPIEGLVLSNSLRSALAAWSKTLAKEIASHQVTINTVIPGKIHTDRIEELNQLLAEKKNKPVAELVQESLLQIPTKRYGTIEEFAAVVCFLASTKASYVTGSQIRVDGGMLSAI